MNRRHAAVAGVVFAVLAAGFGGLAIRRWAPRDRPVNVLVVTLDTTRADRLGCYGYDRAATPALDSLAREGIRFTRAYSHVPLTLPSHATLFTGLLPPEHGLRDNGRGGLNPAIPTLAEAFRSRGFQTAAFVASFTVDKRFGLSRGFDVYDDRMKPAARTDELLEMENTGDVVCDRALAWLADHGGTPFFCWVHFYDPHTPYAPPEPYRSQHRDPYDAEVAFMDAQIRRLVEFLDSRGRGRNTLIVVCGDHGESFGEHGESGHGQFVYNATLHVPLLIRQPGRADAGRTVECVVGLEDVAPTILHAMGWKRPRSMRGADLLRDPPAERHCYGESHSAYFTFGWSPLYSLMSSRWKYIQCPDPEFYDLQNDPAEKTNLFAAKTRLAREFAGRLERMRQDMHEARANPVAIDERAIRTLRSLGYAASGTDAAPTTNTGTRKDPKAMLDVYDACFRAGALLETNRLQEAVELLEPLVSRNPECVQIHEYLARAYSGLKRPAEAAPHMEAALALDPHNRMMIANLGVTRLEMGDPAKAAEILRRGLCLPAGPLENALTNGVPSLTVKMRGDLAAALCQLGETDAAVAECALAIRDDPGNVDAHTTLGNIRNQQGRFAEAIRHYRAILAQVPDDALSLSNLGVALARTGQLDEAIAMHRRAVVARPDSADFHMNMGAALMMAQRTDEALVALRAAVRIDPGSTAPLMSLTSALIYVKQYAEALALWREGLKAQPGNATLAYNLAWWLATCPVSACRNGEEALALAEKLNRGASGKNPFYLDALAAAYAETGKFDKAVEAATRAVEVAAKAGSETTATAVKHRLALYAASKPYHQ